MFSFQSHRLWILFLPLSLLAGVFALYLAFSFSPGLQLDIQFTRDQAVQAAQEFQSQRFPDLTTTRSAAMFKGDRDLQNYVELEAGGISAFKQLMNNVDAATHYWNVRLFSEGQEEELILAYSAQGEPISYRLIIPEQKPGLALDESAARAIAQTGAQEFLGSRFTNYTPLETNVTRQTSGRVDYRFTYEHKDLVIDEARFRLDLKVAGDQLVAVNSFKFIPEGFTQRFAEMRALNTQISQIASFLMLALFGLGGLIGGGVWLFRQHSMQWRPSFYCAGFVSLGCSAAIVSNLPIAWMNYQTTSSTSNFLLQQWALAGGVLLGLGLLFAVIFAVAEGLTRIAFPQQPRIYDFLRAPVAASPESLGNVLGGYAWTGWFLLYAVGFYLLTTTFLGWWQPTDINYDPNILASWRPAIAPIFTALQAGTWEECLFRAIPLALACIIGERLGKQRLVVVSVLILQAIIFAGVHANYPNLPGYSRLIELFIPAIVFGMVYLRFGLIICMLTHFEYDLVLMSMPIFTADDPGLWIDRMLVLLAGTAPLIALFWCRFRQRQWASLAPQWRNSAYVAPTPPTPEPVAEHQFLRHRPALRFNKYWLLPLALSFVVIGVEVRESPRVEWPYFSVDRAEAKALAEAGLTKRGVILSESRVSESRVSESRVSESGESDGWRATVQTHPGWLLPKDFVWHEAGPQVFRGLIGRYLDTPFWMINWKNFEGDVENRTEQWSAWLYPDGRLHELVHTLPEGAPGANLTRAEAIKTATAHITEKGWADIASLEEKSVEEIKRPARTDWTITYADKAAFDHEGGQANIIIKLAGDEVVSYVRAIFVPEEWKRSEEAKNDRETPFKILTAIVALLIIGLAASRFVVNAPKRKFNVAAAIPWVVVTSLPMLLATLAHIDSALGGLDPTMDWLTQVAMVVVGIYFLAVIVGTMAFFAAQAVHGERPLANADPRTDYLLGAALAIIFIGLSLFLTRVLPTNATPVPFMAEYAAYVPWLTTIFKGLNSTLGLLLALIFAIGIVRFVTTPKKLFMIAGLALLFCVVPTVMTREPGVVFIVQLLKVLNILLVVELIRRQQLGVAIAMGCFIIALRQLAILDALYPAAWIHALISMACCAIVGYWLVHHWHKRAVV